jgi:hypothetical protein
MKNNKVLFLLLFIITSTFVPEARAHLPFGKIKPFKSDGCTKFPDGTLFRPSLWRHCCYQHDKKYWIGGSSRKRLQADRELRACVANEGQPEVADLMFHGVRVGGSPYLNTAFRWGYGWDEVRGYHPLTQDEVLEVRKILSQ